MAREWRDETDRWILGECWIPLAIGTLVLAAFGGGKFLDIAISTLVPLIFLLYMDCPCLCNDEIKPEHALNSHTKGGWRESM